MPTPLDGGYSIDTCSLIDGHADKQTRLFLEGLIKAGRLKAPPSVLTELREVVDEAFKWAKGLEHLLIKELTVASALQLEPLVLKYGEPFRDPEDRGKTYPGLIKKRTAHDADPDVIALALDHGWIVVTGDQGIRGACKCENLKCKTLQKLVERETASQERQLPLV